jgi:hypothetical protein
MTMPCERTRALRFAGEVLQELLSRHDVPADLKHQARVTLRHYPSAAEIASQARLAAFNSWIEREDKYERRGNDIDDSSGRDGTA